MDESTSIDAVLFDLDGTLHFGDKEELFARMSAIAEQLGSGISEDEIREVCKLSDYLDEHLMVNYHNQRMPNRRITEDTFKQVNDGISGSYDNHFYTADGAKRENIAAVKASGKAVGLVTTRGNTSRDRLLVHHDLRDTFDVIVGRGDAKLRNRTRNQYPTH